MICGHTLLKNWSEVNSMTSELQELFKRFKSEHGISVGLVDSLNHIDDIIHTDGRQQTLLIYGSYYGDVLLIEKCIKLGADVNKCTRLSPPLCWAFAMNNFTICKILLEAGANPNVVYSMSGYYNSFPLIFHTQLNDYTTLFIKHGALINEFYKYKLKLGQKSHTYFRNLLAKRRWVTIKCLTLVLSLHKRAVERVNHPDRLFQQGYFELKD